MKRQIWIFAGVSLASVVWCIALGVVCSAQTMGPTQPASQPMKIQKSFTLAAVGDIIEPLPTAQLDEPGLQNLLSLLRHADVSVANVENPIIDSVNPRGRGMRGVGMPRTVAADLKAMGIRMANLANNHIMDHGLSGMHSTIALLDNAGIVHAGVGDDLQEARAPRYLSTSKGIVALAGMISVPTDQKVPFRVSRTTYSVGDLAGTPGTNDLHVKTSYIVTADQLKALRDIRDSIYLAPLPANEPLDHLDLFDTWYTVGLQPGGISYAMDPADQREILRNIRNGKEYADFMVVTIHCHQFGSAYQKYNSDPRIVEAAFDDSVPDFLVDLAHQAIDNGADVFIGHGVHTLRGVEIYKGKPIFYGLNSFLFEEPQSPIERASGVQSGPPPYGQKKGWGVFTFGYLPKNLESLLVTGRYEKGQLEEVRLYPVDLGQDGSRPVSLMGVPMTPAPEVARQILQRIQVLSRPFGTVIAIEDNVGVIRVAPGMLPAKK